jgi:hypothetical protein
MRFSVPMPLPCHDWPSHEPLSADFVVPKFSADRLWTPISVWSSRAANSSDQRSGDISWRSREW